MHYAFAIDTDHTSGALYNGRIFQEVGSPPWMVKELQRGDGEAFWLYDAEGCVMFEGRCSLMPDSTGTEILSKWGVHYGATGLMLGRDVKYEELKNAEQYQLF